MLTDVRWSGETGSHTVITKSGDRHRTPSPIDTSSGLSPIAVVLQGMRVQRMSLVQSLRQYAFVHRGKSILYENETLSLTEESQLSSRAT